MHAPEIRASLEEPTSTVSCLAWDPAKEQGAVIDPVLARGNQSGTADTAFADRMLKVADGEEVTRRWVLETHAHADHLTAAPCLKARTGAPIGTGEHITEVQRIFRPVFDARDLKPEGGDFDRLVHDAERLPLGRLAVGVRLALLPEARLWMCHDCRAPGRDTYAWQSTVAKQRAHNPQVEDGRTEAELVVFRAGRDGNLAAPLLPLVQVDIRTGRFPEAEADGVRYLKTPVKERRAEAVA